MKRYGVAFIGFFIFLVLLIPINGHCKTWYVKQDGTGDTPTIQAALDSSKTGDTVLVASGMYYINERIHCSDTDSLAMLAEGGADNTYIIGVSGNGVFDISWLSNFSLIGFTFSHCPVNILHCEHSSIEDNVFNKQSPLFIQTSHYIKIYSNLIHANNSGISCIDYCSNVEICNNVIAYNISSSGFPEGSGLLFDAGSFTVHRNIIVSNSYGISSIATTIYLSCNNVWNNTEYNYDLYFFPDPTGTDGNISLDPQFCGVNPEISGNFYLQSDSPCAPGNHPDAVECCLIGSYPVGCGSTAAKEASWDKIKSIYK